MAYASAPTSATSSASPRVDLDLWITLGRACQTLLDAEERGDTASGLEEVKEILEKSGDMISRFLEQRMPGFVLPRCLFLPDGHEINRDFYETLKRICKITIMDVKTPDETAELLSNTHRSLKQSDKNEP